MTTFDCVLEACFHWTTPSSNIMEVKVTVALYSSSHLKYQLSPFTSMVYNFGYESHIKFL